MVVVYDAFHSKKGYALLMRTIIGYIMLFGQKSNVINEIFGIAQHLYIT